MTTSIDDCMKMNNAALWQAILFSVGVTFVENSSKW